MVEAAGSNPALPTERRGYWLGIALILCAGLAATLLRIAAALLPDEGARLLALATVALGLPEQQMFLYFQF